MKLEEWGKIKKRFRGSLLLGNGASIAIDDRLSYKSLYEKVCNSGKLNEELLEMFRYFETSNFEFIMRLLLEASRVNEVLKIEDEKTKDYYYELRDTLISTIGDIHPDYLAMQHLLIPIANFLVRFRQILSLNYDLLVYWAMLVGNSKLECQWFKDCFINGKLEKDFDYLYKPQPPATGATLVFYPHGNLFLATDIYNDEVKLCRTEKDCLLDTVLSKWKEKDYIPLFVSEGTTSEKFRAITRSSYLNTVYDSVLSRLSDSLVIYGWSASEQDEHILKAIDNKNLKEIAISVYTKDPQWEDYCSRIETSISQTHHIKNADLCFFDAESKGCWIY